MGPRNPENQPNWQPKTEAPNTQNHYTPIDANTRQNNRTPSIQRDNTQQGNTQQQNNTRRPGNSM